ncbi:hypothetical protein GSI_09039 [Ganoderma sinense ZZ0214-1]|uniref:F-box domain-containing protein n=1 Tax=Ganoderma sinense ZZ0214-1 TaxID=1077348 RepID=A0A2G8S5E2_9APHY|nr:hypothetical protein GSI_09039 [Ganoderma sinense ZZ0214-1]
MERLNLPPELLTAILLDLDFRDLLRCRQVNTTFKTLIDKDVRAQYKIELAVAGMTDGPPSTLTPAERLTILRARQDAWDNLVWTAKDDVTMHQGGVWELYGNVLAQAQGDRTLHFKQIPSQIRGIRGTEWTIPNVGCKIRDFGMDPAQDLLVVIEHFWHRPQLTVRIHLKSLSTGAPHPAGPQAGMVTYDPKPSGYSYAIQTSEGYLGIHMSSQGEDASELLIWEWRTGRLHLHITGPELSSFAFLSSRHLLLGVQPALELNEEDLVQGPNNPLLVVIDLESTTSATPVEFSDLDYVCAFHYPTLSDTFIVVAMSVRSDPAPYWRPNPALPVPFSVSHEDRLFVVTLWVMEGNVPLGVLSLVPASTLLNALSSLEPGVVRRDFAWDEWGPEGSRLMSMPGRQSAVWVCYVYGTTYALWGNDHGERAVYTLDFNQLAIRRALARGAADDIADRPMVFKPARMFKEQVRTALPYRARKLASLPEGENRFEAVMVAEDAVVLVSSQSHIRRYCVLSF